MIKPLNRQCKADWWASPLVRAGSAGSVFAWPRGAGQRSPVQAENIHVDKCVDAIMMKLSRHPAASVMGDTAAALAGHFFHEPRAPARDVERGALRARRSALGAESHRVRCLRKTTISSPSA